MNQSRESKSLINSNLKGTRTGDDACSQSDMEEESEAGFVQRSKRRLLCRISPGIASTALVFLMLIITLSAIQIRRGITRAEPQEHKKKYCGSTPTEARQKKCLFEPMLSAWVPLECSYLDVIEEYQETYGDIHALWPWYWDKNATKRVEQEEFDILRAGNYTIIYTPYRASHDLHCLYSWRKVSTALGRNLTTADARSAQFYHATHCAQHITHSLYHPESNPNEAPEIWTFPLMYHDCVSLL